MDMLKMAVCVMCGCLSWTLRDCDFTVTGHTISESSFKALASKARFTLIRCNFNRFCSAFCRITASATSSAFLSDSNVYWMELMFLIYLFSLFFSLSLLPKKHSRQSYKMHWNYIVFKHLCFYHAVSIQLYGAQNGTASHQTLTGPFLKQYHVWDALTWMAPIETCYFTCHEFECVLEWIRNCISVNQGWDVLRYSLIVMVVK